VNLDGRKKNRSRRFSIFCVFTPRISKQQFLFGSSPSHLRRAKWLSEK
jgi:hypothetical protein